MEAIKIKIETPVLNSQYTFPLGAWTVKIWQDPGQSRTENYVLRNA